MRQENDDPAADFRLLGSTHALDLLGRVLTVETVMQPPTLRLTDETLEQALAEMIRRGTDVGYLVAGGDYRGVVTEKAVRTAMASDEPGSVSDIAVAVETVAPGDAIAQALSATLPSSIPVPVVTAEGTLEGVLSPTRVGEVLQQPPATNGDGDDQPSLPLNLPDLPAPAEEERPPLSDEPSHA